MSARILVVDDEESIRAVVARMLQGEGYEVLRARDGLDALRQLREIGGAVDLIVSDLVMPGMGGASRRQGEDGESDLYHLLHE